jgi:protein SCO1/2
MSGRWVLVLVAAAGMGSGYSSPPQPHTGNVPPPPQVGIEQRLGAKVPLDLPFKDEEGNRTTIGACMAGKPTILVLSYYRCPMLCTEVLNGLLAGVRAIPDSAGDSYQIVVVSFDPREKPPLAALKKATYVAEYGRPNGESGWHFLTGDPLAIATLTDTVGFGSKYDRETEQYAHGSGIMILATDGTVSRYLLGVRFEPRDLRLALAEASQGRVGAPADQVLLLCFRYDPTVGKYTFTILKLIRVFSGISLIVLGLFLAALWWRCRNRQAIPPGPVAAADDQREEVPSVPGEESAHGHGS